MKQWWGESWDSDLSCSLWIPGSAPCHYRLQEFHVDVVTFSQQGGQHRNHGLETAVPQGCISWGCVVSLLLYGLEQGQTADASSPNSPTSLKVSARKRQRWDPKPGQSWRLCAQSLPINLHIGWSSPLTYTFSEVLLKIMERYIICFWEHQKRQPLLSFLLLLQILRKLKSLALDTETELERQDEALDGITEAVDRTTLTIDKHNRRMKKLT